MLPCSGRVFVMLYLSAKGYRSINLPPSDCIVYRAMVVSSPSGLSLCQVAMVLRSPSDTSRVTFYIIWAGVSTFGLCSRMTRRGPEYRLDGSGIERKSLAADW